MLKTGSYNFSKYQGALLHILSKLEGRAEPYKGILEIFDNHEEIALAIFIQNCLHPKNA